ncbi:MAG: hypothetical protein JXA04_05070 [Gammaproteobacteria bacterium]|nr:hypothetical protein [Gammaproteobacteria bacterium]
MTGVLEGITGDEPVNWGGIALNAFGSALGNSIAEGIQSRNRIDKWTSDLEKQQSELINEVGRVTQQEIADRSNDRFNAIADADSDALVAETTKNFDTKGSNANGNSGRELASAIYNSQLNQQAHNRAAEFKEQAEAAAQGRTDYVQRGTQDAFDRGYNNAASVQQSVGTDFSDGIRSGNEYKAYDRAYKLANGVNPDAQNGTWGDFLWQATKDIFVDYGNEAIDLANMLLEAGGYSAAGLATLKRGPDGLIPNIPRISPADAPTTQQGMWGRTLHQEIKLAGEVTFGAFGAAGAFEGIGGALAGMVGRGGSGPISGIAKSERLFPAGVDDIIESAARPSRVGSGSSRGLQALQKKIDNPRKVEYFQGLSKNTDTVESIIREAYTTPKPIFDTGINRAGQEFIDIISPTTGRGIRLLRETGEFDTFVNMSKL